MGRPLEIQHAPAFRPLCDWDARYLGAHGGRGSGKSHFFGELAIEDAVRFPGEMGCGMRLVCVREIQKSLKKSAKQLLEDKLDKFRLNEHHGFRIFSDSIQTPGDGVIIFQGMQDHTADSVKSLEGFHRAWIEEGQTLSAASLRLLRPTIREPHSQIWASWNPRFKRDPVDIMLRQKIPTNSKVVEVNWSENYWFPEVLEQERLDGLRDEPEEYDHVWEGGYQVVTKGAYFARRLAECKAQGRITFVPPAPLMTYMVFCDIGGTGGKSDAFTMWVCQFVGMQVRVLNYYEAQGQEFADHVHWLRRQGYIPDNTNIYLPHDGATKDRVFRVSYESSFSGAEYKTIVIPNQGTGAAMQRVEAARRVFPAACFNEETTVDGREVLGAYHAKLDEDRGIDLGPEHDWASHGSDAFGLMAVVYEQPKRKVSKTARVKKRRVRDRAIGF